MLSSRVSARRPARLHVLDAFRALALSAVIVCHYLATWGPPEYSGNLYGYQYSYPVWLGWGALGVEFFFIISGFVIFMTLERCDSLIEFWVRRIARLYPAYVVAMLLTFCVTNAIGPRELQSSAADLWIGFTLTTPFVPGTRFVDQVYWSLIVELQFYGVVGVIYLAAGKRFATAWTLYVAATVACWLFGRSFGVHLLVALTDRVLVLPFLPHFTLGIAFYFRYSGRTRRWRGLAVVAVCTYVITAWRAPVAAHAAHAAMVFLFALFLSGNLGWLAIRPLKFLGEISYSLYLIHENVGIILIALLTQYWRLPDLAAAATAAFVCVGLAFVLTRAVEIPVKRAVLGWARPRLSKVLSRFPRLEFANAPDRAVS